MFEKVTLDFNPSGDCEDDEDGGKMNGNRGSLDAVIKNLKKIGSEIIDPVTETHEDLLSVQRKINKAVARFPMRRAKREMKSNRIIFKESKRKKVTCVTVLHISTNHETLVISSTEDKRISVWALSTANKITNLSGHREKISTMTTYYSDKHDPVLITGSWDESIRVWPLRQCFEKEASATSIENECLYLAGHSNKINQVIMVHGEDYHPYIASAASDRTIRIWNLKGNTLMILEDKRTDVSPTCLASYSKNDNFLLISGYKDNLVRVWNLLNDKESPRLISSHQSKISKLIVFENSLAEPIIATACKDCVIRLFDLFSGTQISSFSDNSSQITSIFVAQHKTGPVLVSGNVSGTIRLWDCNTGQVVRVFHGHEGACTDVALLPLPVSDCLIVFSSSDDCTTRAWFYTEERSMSLLLHDKEVRVNAVASMMNDSKVIVFTGTETGQVVAWSLSPKYEFGTVIWKKTVHTVPIRQLALYTPSHRLQKNSSPLEEQKISCAKPLLVTCGPDSRICFTDPISGEHVKPEIGGVDSVIACLSVYNGYFPTTQEKLAGHKEISPFIVTGGEDNVIAVWSIEKAALSFQLSGHEFDVSALNIFESTTCIQDIPSSPASSKNSGRPRRVTLSLIKEQEKFKAKKNVFPSAGDPWIISGSMDSTVRVWSIKSQQCIHIYSKNESNVNAVASLELDTGPIAVAGCEDTTIYVWRLGKDFSLMYTLIGHKDEIQSLVLHKSPSFEPVLVSGSWDLTINVWSLKSRSVMKTFEGHKREVTAVSICSTDGDAALLSASSDGTVQVHYDFLNMLPKLDAIERAFRFDLAGLNKQIFQNSCTWPRISKFVKDIGPEAFFSHFHFLFRNALEEERSDFITKFLPMTRKGLIESNDSKLSKYSLLRLALEKENRKAVMVIMRCFTKLLTTSNPQKYDELFYHQNARIAMEDLVTLAGIYPTIFQDFVIQLILVPIREKTIPVNSLYLCHDRNKKLSIRRKRETKKISHHNKVQDSEMSSPQHVSSRLKKSKKMEEVYLYIPLENPIHMQMLRAMSEVCRELDSVEIFNSDYGLLALSFAWKSFGKKEHIKQMALYMLYVIVATFSIYSFDAISSSSIWILSFIVIGMQIILDLYFFKIEVLQIMSDTWEYLYDVWNALDLIVICSGLVGNAFRLSYRYETLTSRAFLSIQSISMWFNLLFHLRAFESTGPLVSMILRIAHDMKSLIFVVIIVIIGFSQAFWLLSSGFGKDELPFATVSSSFLHSFSFMLGEYDAQSFDGLPLERFAVFLSTFFMVLVSLLLLNLLIALMGDSYADVREKGQAQWRLEQINLIIESASNMDESDLTRSDPIYFRKWEDDMRSGADLIEQSYSLEERMVMLEEKIDKLTDKLTKDNKPLH